MSRRNKGYTRKNYRRNSKKNPWRNTRQKPIAKRIDWRQVVAVFLIISIPLTCICLSAALLMRTTDTYQYSLRASQAVEQSFYVVSAEDVAEKMASYIGGKEDALVLLEQVEYEPENVFGKNDQAGMANLRHWLNILTVVGGISFLITFVLYFLLIRWRAYDVHRKFFKGACITFPLLLIVSSAMKLVPSLRIWFYNKHLGVDFKEEDFIYIIFGEGFPKQITIFEDIAATILFLVIAYITWKLIGKRKVFKNREISIQ